MGLSVKIRLIRVIRVPLWVGIFVSSLSAKNKPQMNEDLLHRNIYKSKRPLPIAPAAPSVYR
jgi:hypothetical protein